MDAVRRKSAASDVARICPSWQMLGETGYNRFEREEGTPTPVNHSHHGVPGKPAVGLLGQNEGEISWPAIKTQYAAFAAAREPSCSSRAQSASWISARWKSATSPPASTARTA